MAEGSPWMETFGDLCADIGVRPLTSAEPVIEEFLRQRIGKKENDARGNF